MTGIAGRIGRQLALFVVYGTVGALVACIALLAWLGTANKPDLKPWHQAALREEFTRADADRIRTLAEYGQLEERLLAELRSEVYDTIDPRDRRPVNRFSAGSRADPTGFPENANRSFVLTAANPRAAVLMIHGLSDSPYVMRALGERLQAAGCEVVGLRLPGHGTAPAGLLSITWQDWAAAVRMAARDLRQRVAPGTPLYLVGFSTGAALSVEYALAGLEGEDLPHADGLVLISPAIGVDPLAWLAIWQLRLAAVPGLGKLAWLDILPEYDPYKYNSFTVNAGDQIYRLTRELDARLTRLAGRGPVTGFPRTLVFQSVADATVSPLAVVKLFLARLAPEGHALVAFDINRTAEAEPLYRPGVRDPAERLLGGDPWPFDVTLLNNADPGSAAIVARRRVAGASGVTVEPTGFAWATGYFALSHVALPIAPEDPIYGAERPARQTAVYLGHLELAGEQNLLQVPSNALIRLRYNPFFPIVQARTLAFIGLAPATPAAPAQAAAQ